MSPVNVTLTSHGIKGDNPTLVKLERNAKPPVRGSPTPNTHPMRLNFFKQDVLSRAPLQPCYIGISEPVRGTVRRTTQAELLLLSCSASRLWSLRLIRSTRRPSGAWPFSPRRFEGAVHLEVHPWRMKLEMLMSRNLSAAHAYTICQTHLRPRTAVL